MGCWLKLHLRMSSFSTVKVLVATLRGRPCFRISLHFATGIGTNIKSTSMRPDYGTAPIGRFPCIFVMRSEEHTSELQSLMRISYAVFCLKKKNKINTDILLL